MSHEETLEERKKLDTYCFEGRDILSNKFGTAFHPACHLWVSVHGNDGWTYFWMRAKRHMQWRYQRRQQWLPRFERRVGDREDVDKYLVLSVEEVTCPKQRGRTNWVLSRLLVQSKVVEQSINIVQHSFIWQEMYLIVARRGEPIIPCNSVETCQKRNFRRLRDSNSRGETPCT